MRALALLLSLGWAVRAYGLHVGNTTTYITLHHKNAYLDGDQHYGVGDWDPDEDSMSLTAEQCQRFCSEDSRCGCATQSLKALMDPKSKHQCWRHNDCHPVGFRHSHHYNVYMQVATPWSLQGLTISNYTSFVAGLNTTTAGVAISRGTVSAFTVRSRSAARMSLTTSAASDGVDVYAVELLANGTVSIPGHGLQKLSWEAGVSLHIEPGQPGRPSQVVADLGYVRLPLAGTIEADALHAKVVLYGAQSSAEVLEVRPREDRRTAANVTTLSYATLWNKNAWKGYGGHWYGGWPLSDPDWYFTASSHACQAMCSEEPQCDCATWKRSQQQCWLRKDCQPKNFTSKDNRGFNVFMKIRAVWLQEGASFSSNRFSKANATSAQPAVATSHTPLQSLTVSVGCCGLVGLSTSSAPDSDSAAGSFFVNVSNGSVSFPVQGLRGGGGDMRLPYKGNAEIRLFTRNGEVLVEFPGSKELPQFPLGASFGALYGKIVLWEAGSSVSVRNLTVYTPPPTLPQPAESVGWQVALCVSIAVLIAISLAATLAVVRCRRRRSSAADIARPRSGTPEVAPMPVLLGCSGRARSNGIAAASADSKLMSNPAYAAISLEQLSELRERARKALGREFKTATMHDVSSKVLQPLCLEHGLCYAHYVNSSRPLKVNVFISHAWQENFDEFVTSVQSVFSHWTVKPSLWICATALLQGPAAAKMGPSPRLPQVGAGEDLSAAPFVQALAEASRLLVVRNGAVDLFDRIWCCWELYCAHRQGLLRKPGSLMVVGPQRFGGVPTVDVNQASSSDPEDKRRILLHILQQGILDEVNQFLTDLAFRAKEGEEEMTLP